MPNHTRYLLLTRLTCYLKYTYPNHVYQRHRYHIADFYYIIFGHRSKALYVCIQVSTLCISFNMHELIDVLKYPCRNITRPHPPVKSARLIRTVPRESTTRLPMQEIYILNLALCSLVLEGRLRLGVPYFSLGFLSSPIIVRVQYLCLFMYATYIN